MPTSKEHQQERWHRLTWLHFCFLFRLKTHPLISNLFHSCKACFPEPVFPLRCQYSGSISSHLWRFIAPTSSTSKNDRLDKRMYLFQYLGSRFWSRQWQNLLYLKVFWIQKMGSWSRPRNYAANPHRTTTNWVWEADPVESRGGNHVNYPLSMSIWEAFYKIKAPPINIKITSEPIWPLLHISLYKIPWMTNIWCCMNHIYRHWKDFHVPGNLDHHKQMLQVPTLSSIGCLIEPTLRMCPFSIPSVILGPKWTVEIGH